MNRFKNISIFILSGALALSFAACSSPEETSEVTSSSESTTITSEASDSESSETSGQESATASDTSDQETSGSTSEETKSSRSDARLAEIAAVNYSDYKLSESDDLKEMEKKIKVARIQI